MQTFRRAPNCFPVDECPEVGSLGPTVVPAVRCGGSFRTVKEIISKMDGGTFLQTTTMTRNSYNYIKNPVKKMGKGPEQTFFQRRHTNGQQAREKRLTITHHQGNANENHEEAPPPPCRSHTLRPAPLQVLRPPPVEKQANSEDTPLYPGTSRGERDKVTAPGGDISRGISAGDRDKVRRA